MATSILFIQIPMSLCSVPDCVHCNFLNISLIKYCLQNPSLNHNIKIELES